MVTSTGYTNSRQITLHFAVVYLNVPWPSNIVQPAYASGTTLKLKTRYAGQYQPIPPSAIQPSTGPTPGPNTQLSQYIALNEYTIEWDRVQDLDSLDFSGLIGAVNSDEFMGCPPGTLFCAGARKNHPSSSIRQARAPGKPPSRSSNERSSSPTATTPARTGGTTG